MALQKVNYESNKTVISAKNLNDMQDEIIANQQAVDELKAQVATLVPVKVE